MTDLKQAARDYAAGHAGFERSLGGAQPEWLSRSRREALERFSDVGFPTRRREEWRYTNVAPIAAGRFMPPIARSELADLGDSPLAGLEGFRLTFVDGLFAPHLSATVGLPDGVRITSLAEALASQPELLESHLARTDSEQDNPFADLNTAFLRDGAVVTLDDGSVLDTPLYLAFVSTSPGEAPATHLRNLILAGRGSRATIVETFGGVEGAYLTNARTELRAGENASIEHYRIQDEGAGAFHLAGLEVWQGRASRVHSHHVALGGALARNDVQVQLEGEGAEVVLDGLYLVDGSRHCDCQSTVDHRVPHARSDEYYKGILTDRSEGVFNGKVIVRPDAQKTEAHQNNRNLLLSDDVQVHTRPVLEINADDVKCSHGATIGRLGEDALFYLRSRGLDEPQARRMLTQAFAGEVLDRIRVEPLRRALHRMLDKRLARAAIQAAGEVAP